MNISLKTFFGIFWVCLFSAIFAGAQNLKGVVKDAQTGEPLAFVNILACSKGTSTDLQGKFSLQVAPDCKKLTFSYIGYKTESISLTDSLKSDLLVLLSPSVKMMSEVVIGGENPAHEIIRKVMAKRKENDPKKIPSFRYEAYNKFVFSPVFNFPDTSKARKNAENFNLLIIESVTQRKFIAPDRDHELVVGNKVSGFENPQFTMLATQLQPFTFYDDEINFFNKTYVSPVAQGTFSRYDFDLYDSIRTEKDTVYLIAFEPKAGKNFEGLKGVLYVNKDNFALQNVIAEPQKADLVNFKIQQRYQKTQNQWFPEQINMDVHFLKYPRPDVGMLMRGQSFISAVEINPDLSDEKFPIDKIEISPDAHKQNEDFWQQKRYDTLTRKDENTYRVLDSLSKKMHLEKIINTIGYAAADALPLGFLSLKISDLIFKSNGFEGLRLGLHLFTNEKLSRFFSLGGYAAYGFRDQAFKYGGNLQFNIARSKDLKINFFCNSDLAEPTRPFVNFTEMRSFGNAWLMKRAERIEQYGAELTAKPFRFADVTLRAVRQERRTLYDYGFERHYSPEFLYRNAEINFDFRYAYGEKFAQSYGARYSLGTRYPVLILRLTKGYFEANEAREYEKIQLLLTKTFRSKRIGVTRVSLEGGLLTGQVPYGLLFGTRAQSGDAGRFVYQYNAFQTQGLYEFAASQFLHAHIEHNFGKLLFRRKNFEPEPALAFNAGYGVLNNADAHRGIAVSGYDKIYYEGGVLIYNILKINYLNIGRLGFGVGAFYRMGHYKFAKPEDNLNYKVLLNFSF